MEISIKGGAPYISRFELALGQGGSFVISDSEQSYDDYDADLEQIELFDFNADGVNEIILLFDSLAYILICWNKKCSDEK